MKIRLFRAVAIAFVFCTILFTPLDSVFAATVKSNNVDTTKKAAQEVVKDTGAKKQFGKNDNGNQLIDSAKVKASQKLNNLAEKADSSENVTPTEKRFLDNLQDKS
ncbi:conserved exported hypothetical protein [Hyella patelloides LEGE 07179]|uniref:Low temperature-induced protein n=1 Tax=Hyella patelloides LEGE 07179 TaxID=945734 RepID=A0A563VLY0_9CYAN|nr:hypothetical protein [Hyella patelloides]VEP12460.1 conserved exported hypothetical protein [Hyella patelloides LEGE 07179]